MSETVTFICGQKESNPNHRFSLTVTSEFFKKHQNLTVEKAQDMTIFELLSDPYQAGTFLHCETGPAFFTVAKNPDGKPKHREYWLNGNRVDKEQAKKMEHDMEFGSTVDKIINSEDSVNVE